MVIVTFHAYYPARGRKHEDCFFRDFHWNTELSRLLPRKGTETNKRRNLSHIFIGAFTPITPQGDGNGRPFNSALVAVDELSRLLPRKGTETLGLHDILPGNLAKLSRLLPRKGTET